MSLTAGSTLQNGKYLIQGVLHQSDFGVTYQAFHTLLSQIVVLQTINDSLREHQRFEQIRQQFLVEVRRLAKKQPPIVAVRDCFEESGMPFVVLERVLGQTPARLGDWMHVLNPIILESPSDTAPAQSNSPVNRNASAQIPAAPSVSPSTTSAAPVPNASEKTAPVAVVKQMPVPTGAIAPPHPDLRKLPQPQRRGLPIALAITSIVAGLAGAALSLNLRYQDSKPPGTPSLFSSEQSFPPREDWLGTDPYANAESDRPGDYAPSNRIRQRETPLQRRNRTEAYGTPRYNPAPDLAAEPTPAPINKQIPAISPPADPTPSSENPAPRPAPAAPAPVEIPIPKAESLPAPAPAAPPAPMVVNPPAAAPAPVSQ